MQQTPSAHLDGRLEPGASPAWTSFGFTVTSTVYDLVPQQRVLWGGTGDAITGIHKWLFTDTTSGVHVTTIESFAGPPVDADVAGMQSVLDGSLTSWLAHLQTAAQTWQAGGTA